MNFLCIDAMGTGLALSMRAAQAGHAVKLFVSKDEKQNRRENGDGIPGIERVAHWEPWLRWADLVWLTDNSKYLTQLDPYRKLGYPIFGPNEESAKLEQDREHGQKVLREHGIATIPSKTFHDYEAAERYIINEFKKDKDKRFVSKPNGDKADKSMTYCAKSAADMAYMLRRWNKNPKYRAMARKYGFVMQEFVPGVEFAVSGWIGKDGFLEGWEENFEFKKLMPGDYGVATGEQGTVIRHVRKSKLATQTIAKLEDYLLKIGHVGDIDVNCIIDEDGRPWVLEFTARAGWPADIIKRTLYDGDPIQWMADALEGKDTLSIRYDEIAVGFVYTIPDYPYSKFTKKEVCGIPIYGVNGSPHFHPQDCKMVTAPLEVDGKIVDAPMLGSSGDYIAVITGTGDTVKQAKAAALKSVKQIEMPNSPMIRVDVGDRLKKQLPLIQAHGYAVGMKYS